MSVQLTRNAPAPTLSLESGAEMGDHAARLSEDGAVLLVSTYELGHQPFAIASAAGFLERRGYSPALLDLAVEPLDEAKVARAEVVAISTPMHTALRLAVRAAARIRALNPTCRVAMFGHYAALNARHLFDAHGIDAVLAGEVESALCDWVDALAADTGRIEPIAGVSTRTHHARPVLARLDFAPPSRAKLPPLEKYARLEWKGERGVVGYVEASRGCKHLCRHCPIPPVYGGRFFAVPRNVVLDDVRALVRMGATHITFGDPDFLNGPAHALRIVRALHNELPHVTYDFTAKVAHLIAHADLLPELAATGCIFIVTAVESLNDRVLRALDKGHTRADVLVVLRACERAGVALRPTFVAFTPWTTLADYLDVLDMIESEGLIDHVDPVQLTVRLLVPPGSALLDQDDLRPFLRGLDEAALVHRWAHPDPRMDALHVAVTRIVEGAVHDGEDASTTFAHIRALATEATHAADAANRDAIGAAWPRRDTRPAALARARTRKSVPRLTEPWFC